MTHVRQRHRHPHERDRRMLHGNRCVQHVHLDACARPPRPADAVRARRYHLRTLRVVLHRGEICELLERIADDPAVLRDERDARRQEVANPDRLVLEFGDCGKGRAPAHQLRRQPRLGHQRRLDLIVHLPSHGRREKNPGHAQSENGRGERGEKELRLEGRPDPRHRYGS